MQARVVLVAEGEVVGESEVPAGIALMESVLCSQDLGGAYIERPFNCAVAIGLEDRAIVSR